MTTDQEMAASPIGRLASLHVFRGISMFLLAADGAAVYEDRTQARSPDSLAGYRCGFFR